MGHSKKSKPVQESDVGSGEEFSDVDDSATSSSDSSDGDYAVQIPQENWNLRILGPRAERSEYTEALKDAQLKINELQLLVRTLSARNTDLTIRLKQFKKYKPTASAEAKTRTKEKLSEPDQRIAQAAKHFGVMHEQFIPHSAFLVPQPAIRSTDSVRYQSDESKVKGITAELYEVVPTDLHKQMAKSVEFRTLFLSKLRSGRRTMIFQLRSKTAPDIFSHPSKFYQPSFNRAAVDAFRNELLFEGETKYSKYAPILFPKDEIEPGKFVRKRNMQNLFRNVQLTKMLKSILFGGSSLSSNKPPSPKTQGMIWGVKFVTPGAIALMAILAIFLHSPDQEFASIGAKSDIPYEKWFNSFKSFLMTNAKKKQVRELYMWWNGRVFPSNKRDQATARAQDADLDESSGMEEARLGLCLSEANDSDFELASMPSKRATGQQQVDSDLEVSQEDEGITTRFNQLTFNPDESGELDMPEPQDIYHKDSSLHRHASGSQLSPRSEQGSTREVVEPPAEIPSKSRKPVKRKGNTKDKKGKERADGVAMVADTNPEVQVAQEERIVEKVVAGRKTTRRGKK